MTHMTGPMEMANEATKPENGKQYQPGINIDGGLDECRLVGGSSFGAPSAPAIARLNSMSEHRQHRVSA